MKTKTFYYFYALLLAFC